jgi:hypothetical protein
MGESTSMNGSTRSHVVKYAKMEMDKTNRDKPIALSETGMK